MIISCPDCNKQFKINPALIPIDGRDLKCGSCNHVWFYKIEDKISEALLLKENDIDNNVESVNVNKKKDQIIEIEQNSSQNVIDKKDNKNDEETADRQILKKSKEKGNSSSKFFSYLVVSIISFIALIVLVDTFKTPLINVFPGLEILLFNLFEILKDIKLFIIDLY